MDYILQTEYPCLSIFVLQIISTIAAILKYQPVNFLRNRRPLNLPIDHKAARNCIPGVVTIVIFDAVFSHRPFDLQEANQILEDLRQKLISQQTDDRWKVLVKAMIYYAQLKMEGDATRSIIFLWILTEGNIEQNTQNLNYYQKQQLLYTLKWLEDSRIFSREDRQQYLCTFFSKNHFDQVMMQMQDEKLMVTIIKSMKAMLKQDQQLTAQRAFYLSPISVFKMLDIKGYTYLVLENFNIKFYLNLLRDQMQKLSNTWLYFKDNSNTVIKNSILTALFPLIEIPKFLKYISEQQNKFESLLKHYYLNIFPFVLRQILNQKQEGPESRKISQQKYTVIIQSIKCHYGSESINLSAKHLNEIYGMEEGTAYNLLQLCSRLT